MKNNNLATVVGSWPRFSEEEITAVTRVLKSGKINQWTGNEVCEFEKEYAKYLGVDYAIALANGSVALDLALIVLGIGDGDEVIVTPRTFVASASCIALRGASPVFAEVDRDSQNITLESVKKVFTDKTKAIIAVHLAGWPCELNKLRKFCDENNVFLVEDCAQSHGAKYNGKPVGSFGNISAFSFCQDKIITTGGEGGLLVTNDKKLWSKAWSYKDHGKDYDLISNKSSDDEGFSWVVRSFGTNYRMTEMQAAIGRIQLRKLDLWVEKRRKFANMFNDAFANCPALRTTIPPDKCFHSYYKYYTFLRPERLKGGWSKSRIIKKLNEKGIFCSEGTCSEVYLEKPFHQYYQERLSVAKELGETSMMFLVHPTLNGSDIHYVIEVVKGVMKAATK